jgi:hypothetical protein
MGTVFRALGHVWRSRCFLVASVICACTAPGARVALANETRLTIVESSPTCWPSNGYSDYTVTPADGWTFQAFHQGSVWFNIEGPPPPGTHVDWWSVGFSAPSPSVVLPGFYPDALNWGTDPSRPGFYFVSTGRGDTTATGFFHVYEAMYGTGGTMLSFAADFTYYGDSIEENYAIVQIRYNATIPEPSLPLGALGTSCCMLVRARRRRRDS